MLRSAFESGLPGAVLVTADEKFAKKMGKAVQKNSRGMESYEP
jgi:hypothetical protein